MFPEAPRVIYRRNTLEEVICQVRFPPILKIDAEIPSAFQEAIRGSFPQYSEESGLSIEGSLPAELMALVKAGLSAQRQKRTRRFSSADERWSVTLASDFLALSTPRYVRWSEFESQLSGPLAALTEIYHPAFFSRIGLRYRNAIQRSALGVKDEPWSKLLRPHILGELGEAITAASVRELHHQVVIGLGDRQAVRVRHGLGRKPNVDEDLYVIDADFFAEGQIGVEGARDILRDFSRDGRLLLAWCITEQLHDAMAPEPRDVAV